MPQAPMAVSKMVKSRAGMMRTLARGPMPCRPIPDRPSWRCAAAWESAAAPKRRERPIHLDAVRGYSDQSRGDGARGVTHRVVGGRDVMDAPARIGFEPG